MDGRVALITGATGHIGPAVARRLAADGWTLVLHHRASAGIAEALAHELGAAVEAGSLDDPEAARNLGARALACFGRVDALVHLAGGFREEPLMTAFPESWRRDFSVHAEAFHALVTWLAPGMRARKRGRVVAFGMAGMERWPAYRQTTGHAVAKAAVLMMARAFARELGDDGVTVNVVAPGRVLGEGRGAEEVAEVVRWVLSDAASGVNGAILPVQAGAIGLSPE